MVFFILITVEAPSAQTDTQLWWIQHKFAKADVTKWRDLLS